MPKIQITLEPKSCLEPNPEQTLRHQRQMYGMSESEMCQDLQFLVKLNSYHAKSLTEVMNMSAMSILSDCQEALERGLNEQARQYINKAKWLMMYFIRD